MRVTQEQIGSQVVRLLSSLQVRQAELQRQASTGVRLERASEGPSEAARIAHLQADRHTMRAHRANADQAEALLNVGYASMRQMHDGLSRAQEIATMSTGVLPDPSSLQTFAAEVDRLIEQTVELAQTEHDGKYLFAGELVGDEPFTTTADANGKITGVSYVGGNDEFAFEVGGGTRMSPVQRGSENGSIVTLVDELIQFRDALETGDPDVVLAARQTLSDVEDDLLVNLSELGNKQSRLQTVRTIEDARYLQTAEEVSGLADADLAQTLLELNQSQVAYEAAMRSAATLLQTSLLNHI